MGHARSQSAETHSFGQVTAILLEKSDCLLYGAGSFEKRGRSSHHVTLQPDFFEKRDVSASVVARCESNAMRCQARVYLDDVATWKVFSADWRKPASPYDPLLIPRLLKQSRHQKDGASSNLAVSGE